MKMLWDSLTDYQQKRKVDITSHPSVELMQEVWFSPVLSQIVSLIHLWTWLRIWLNLMLELEFFFFLSCYCEVMVCVISLYYNGYGLWEGRALFFRRSCWVSFIGLDSLVCSHKISYWRDVHTSCLVNIFMTLLS